MPKGTHWLLGNFFAMLQPNHHLFLRQTAKDVGGIYCIRFLWVQVQPPIPDAAHPECNTNPQI